MAAGSSPGREGRAGHCTSPGRSALFIGLASYYVALGSQPNEGAPDHAERCAPASGAWHLNSQHACACVAQALHWEKVPAPISVELPVPVDEDNAGSGNPAGLPTLPLGLVLPVHPLGPLGPDLCLRQPRAGPPGHARPPGPAAPLSAPTSTAPLQASCCAPLHCHSSPLTARR